VVTVALAVVALVAAAPPSSAEQSSATSAVRQVGPSAAAAAAAVTPGVDCRRATVALRKARAANARPHRTFARAIAAQNALERARRQKSWLCVAPATTCSDAKAASAKAAEALAGARLGLQNTGGSWNRSDLRAATRAYTRAAANSQALCDAEALDNFSGQVGDPRPVGWVRPADGSGLAGSNDLRVTVSPNCPVTASYVRMVRGVHNSTPAGGPTVQERDLFVGMPLQNYSSTDVSATVDVWILDQAGRPLEAVKPDPSGHLRPAGAVFIPAWGASGHGNSFLWWDDAWDLSRFTYRAVIACQVVQ
jgi:hypothetical protein